MVSGRGNIVGEEKQGCFRECDISEAHNLTSKGHNIQGISRAAAAHGEDGSKTIDLSSCFYEAIVQHEIEQLQKKVHFPWLKTHYGGEKLRAGNDIV